MTSEQIASLARSLLLAMGSILTTLGFVSPEDWGKLMNSILTIVGAVAVVVPIVWSMLRHSKIGIVNAAAKLPEVQEIVTTPKVAATALSDKVRSERGR